MYAGNMAVTSDSLYPLKEIQTRLESPGLWGQIVGSGDLVIVDAGAEYRVPSVLRGRALRDCIVASQTARRNARGSEVGAGDSSDSASNVGTPWFQGQPLEEFVVQIPAVPEEVYRGALVKNAADSAQKQLLRWKIKEGDWVEKYQAVAEYDVTPLRTTKGLVRAVVVAPATGQITRIGLNIEYANWNSGDGKRKPISQFGMRDISFFMRPIVESEHDIDFKRSQHESYASIYAYHHISIYAEFAGMLSAARELALDARARTESLAVPHQPS